MVQFQGAFVRRNPAQFTTKLCNFKNLIAQGAADVTSAATTVLPNRVRRVVSGIRKVSLRRRPRGAALDPMQDSHIPPISTRHLRASRHCVC
jgi:hypothetical protein